MTGLQRSMQAVLFLTNQENAGKFCQTDEQTEQDND
jgi:hypothetical protein